MIDFTKFLTIKYKKNGTDYSGADCYGFANIILRDVYNNYKFPDLNYNGAVSEYHAAKSAPQIAHDNGIKKIDQLTEGCFVRMNGELAGTHCGVYIGKGKVISISGVRTPNVMIEPIEKLQVLDLWI